MKLFTALVLLFSIAFASFGQGENNIWIFGYNGGLDFNSGSPVVFSPTFSSGEGCASICDDTGQLLFYTNGWNIYDRTSTIMPNGSYLVGTDPSSTVQSAVIIQNPADNNQYYVFTLGCLESSSGELHYSIVDMSLNGGLGDVLTTAKGIMIDDDLSEKMTAVSGKCSERWLMVHSRSVKEYKAYKISASGIELSPVISSIGTAINDAYSSGTIKFSSDGSKMAAALYSTPLYMYSGIELYDFDINTGVLSNPQLIDSVGSPGTVLEYYSVCFSPDNKKLYGTILEGKVTQFDLSLSTLAAIRASRTAIYETTSMVMGDIKNGPDGKIYIASAGLHVIDYPNNAGASCSFTPSSISVPCAMGLPNVNIINTASSAIGAGQSGTQTSCIPFYIHSLGNGTGFSWNTGDVADSILATSSGTYWVTYTNDCGLTTDTIHVIITPTEIPSLGNDIIQCEGEPFRILLTANVTDTSSIIWSTGDTSKSIYVDSPGIYKVTTGTPPCTASDEIEIKTASCKKCISLIPTVFSPNNDGINEVFIPKFHADCETIQSYIMHVFNRWGECIFTTNDPAKGWDGNYKSQHCETGTYFYEISQYINNKREIFKGDIILIR